MYAPTADIADCDSNLVRYISRSSLSTICMSPSMLAGLLHMWAVNGSNLHGAWVYRGMQIHAFISMNRGWFSLWFKRLRTLRKAMVCLTNTVSKCSLSKKAVPNLGVHINAQSCRSQFFMLCICCRRVRGFFCFVYVFSGCKLNFCLVMFTMWLKIQFLSRKLNL